MNYKLDMSKASNIPAVGDFFVIDGSRPVYQRVEQKGRSSTDIAGAFCDNKDGFVCVNLENGQVFWTHTSFYFTIVKPQSDIVFVPKTT